LNQLVSIIIPVFNRFELARRAIISVLSQKYVTWELIVVDDYSSHPFSLPDEVRSFKQNCLLIRNENNLGPGLTRQKGLDICKGEFVCFLDSDDYYHSDFILDSLKIHNENNGIAATYATSKYINTDTIRAGSDCDYITIMPTLFMYNRPWPTCSWLWKRKYISSWRDVRTNQDSLFELECSLNNNSIRHVPRILCYIDKGTGSNTEDLVSQLNSDLDRNIIVHFALNHLNEYNIIGLEYKQLKDSIIKRFVFVTSKLAGHGRFSNVFQNGLRLLQFDRKVGFILVILSLPLTLPFPIFRQLIKKIIIKL